MIMNNWLCVVPKLDADHALVTWRIYDCVSERPIDTPYFRSKADAERAAKRLMQAHRDAERRRIEDHA